MFWIVSLAALLRIVLSAHPGYIPDIGLFQTWAEKGAVSGMAFIYDTHVPGEPTDYPPLIPYMYIAAAKLMYWLTGTYTHNWTFRALMKIPAIASDLALVVGSYAVLRPIYGEKRARLAAALLAFFPATWFLSAMWGQTDSVYALILTGAIVAIAARRLSLAGALAGMALLTKFQAVAYFPLFAGLVVVEWRRIHAFALGAFGAMAAIVLPFIITGKLTEVGRAYSHAFGAYPLVSIDALGIWNVFFLGRGDKVGDAGTFSGISYKAIGLLLFGTAAALLMAWLVLRLRERRDSLGFRERLELTSTCAAVFSIAFFTLPTQIHERYFFPFLIFALPWALANRVNGSLYTALISVFFLNILAVFLAEPHYGYPYWGAPALKTALSIVFISVAAIVVFRMLKIPNRVPSMSVASGTRISAQPAV